MDDRKLVYVNSLGQYEEHSEALDSAKFLSMSFPNFELTNTKLGKLIDGVDASDEHIHDARYFRENEFLDLSAGAADAGKPIKLDAEGKLDATMLNDADVDHGSVGGLSDDDHTQYSLSSGVRDYSGIVKYSSHPSFTTDT